MILTSQHRDHTQAMDQKQPTPCPGEIMGTDVSTVFPREMRCVNRDCNMCGVHNCIYPLSRSQQWLGRSNQIFLTWKHHNGSSTVNEYLFLPLLFLVTRNLFYGLFLLQMEQGITGSRCHRRVMDWGPDVWLTRAHSFIVIHLFFSFTHSFIHSLVTF